MGWPPYRKKHPAGPITWEYVSESVPIERLDAYEQEKRAAKWRVKGFYWVGVTGEVLVRSERSSEYAPTPKKAKAKTVKPGAPAQAELIE